MKINCIFAVLSLFCVTSAPLAQSKIYKVDQMPNIPSDYELRDWRKVAVEQDEILFDLQRRGEHLPIIWIDPRQNSCPDHKTFALPPYVGSFVKKPEQYDTITCFGAIIGASLAGVDKSSQNGRDWVSMIMNYYSPKDGIYLNNVPGNTGGSFWYEILPNILFYRVLYHYPKIQKMQEHFITVADSWYDACVGMGGGEDPYIVPDFNHTSYDFTTGKPVDNGIWVEADSSAGIAWISYMAYTKTGNPKYLTAAKWGMDYLQKLDKNPFYEMLFPHGIYIAARMNAEQNADYDLQKLLNWCFDGSNKRQWGINAGKWGDKECSGLKSSTVADHGYAFAMNTFNAAGNLTPIARYDERFARDIGKWMLNVASNSRYFYSYAHSPDSQTDWDWSKEYDPNSSIAYEGLQQQKNACERVDEGIAVKGQVVGGGIDDTKFTNKVYHVIEADDSGLEYIWVIGHVKGLTDSFNIAAHTGNGSKVSFHYSTNLEDNYQHLFDIENEKYNSRNIESLPTGKIYIKAIAAKGTKLYVDDIYNWVRHPQAPYATGDPKDNGWGKTNLGLYGSVFVGILGAIIEPTDQQGIIALDCLATDYFHAPAYPTHLYYNPYSEAKNITIDCGTSGTDLYDTVSNQFAAKDVTGKFSLQIAADKAVVIVSIPSGGKVKVSEGKKYVNDIVIDYNLE